MKRMSGRFSWLYFSLLFLAAPSVSSAASLYIDPATSELNRGDSVTMAVRVDTDENARECVNAVDAVISYSQSIEPIDVSVGDSIFSMWVESPTINRESRTITFAGGIPNGYCGRVVGDPRLTNVLAEIVFRSPGVLVGGGDVDRTKAEVFFEDATTAYLNDGFGTKASLTTYGAKIALNDRLGTELKNDWRTEVAADNIPPEPFTIELVTPGSESRGQYYIVFNTTDKQTGIDQYQVMEEPISQFRSFRWGASDAPWIEARSPYVLQDQNLNSIIRVKAIDKAGNEYVAHFIPEDSLRTLSQASMIMVLFIILIVLLVLAIVITLIRYIKRKHQQRKDSLPEENEGDAEEVIETEHD
ncbi:MAG: hypothetical protein KC877_00670 [Candidatus Kaiserbacteria bacterium]|nr:hypothetical protein [Candidatus Kaiserbacteria bacterium]MCB9815944.1 hypothetical protein [Candidatus Nomurabacteria bacterium]